MREYDRTSFEECIREARNEKLGKKAFLEENLTGFAKIMRDTQEDLEWKRRKRRR